MLLPLIWLPGMKTCRLPRGMKYLVGIYNHADRGELAHILRLTIRGNEIYRALERTRTDSNAPLSAEIEAQGNKGDYSNQDEEETDAAGAVEPRSILPTWRNALNGRFEEPLSRFIGRRLRLYR